MPSSATLFASLWSKLYHGLNANYDRNYTRAFFIIYAPCKFFTYTTILEIHLLLSNSLSSFQVRDELENLLDDDMDMAEMYLTDKLAQMGSEAASKDDNEINNDECESDIER